MNRAVIASIIFVIFFSLYTLMNYYAYNRLNRIINFHYLWIIILTLAISFPLSMFLERAVNNVATRGFYFISATWLGILFLSVVSFMIVDLIVIITKIKYSSIGVYALFLIAALVLYAMINAQIIQVKNVEIKNSKIGDKELKIVQLSDIHIGAIHRENFMQRIVDKTNSLNPDFVVITGDFFDGSDGIPKDELRPLSILKAKTFFVTGNHENYIGKANAIKALEAHNITVLSNELKNYKEVQIIGLEYPTNDLDKSKDKLKSFNISEEKLSIVLYHQPVPQIDADIQLSGHTHDGQIFPFNFLVRTAYKYTYGLYKINNTQLYVSQGLGTWGPPMRLFTNPEIVEITVKN